MIEDDIVYISDEYNVSYRKDNITVKPVISLGEELTGALKKLQKNSVPEEEVLKTIKSKFPEYFI